MDKQGYKHIVYAGYTPKSWSGHVSHAPGRQGALVTTTYYTATEAARAVDRYLYKLGKPKNFPVEGALKVELDALSIEEIERQFRKQRLEANWSKGTSKYRGVFWAAKDKRWKAKIKHEKYQVSLGGFAEECDAAEAYDAASYLLRGKDAPLNDPDKYNSLIQEEGEELAARVLGSVKMERINEVKKKLARPWSVKKAEERAIERLGKAEALALMQKAEELCAAKDSKYTVASLVDKTLYCLTSKEMVKWALRKQAEEKQQQDQNSDPAPQQQEQEQQDAGTGAVAVGTKRPVEGSCDDDSVVSKAHRVDVSP